LARRLNRQRYELVVIPDRSRLLGVAARLGRPGRYLQASGAGKDPFRHEIDVYLDVLEAAGLDILDREPRLEPDDRGRHEAGSILDWTAGAPFAVLQPGGAVNPGTSMLDKRWPWERYAALAAWLQERGYMVLLSGGADDYPLCQQVTGRASLSLDRIIAGQLSLQGMAALLQSAALYVGNDTGMSHVAAAVGVPSVVVFGPTNPRRYGPRGRCVSIVAPPESRFIVTNDLRRAASVALPSTEMVPLEDVVIACEERLTAGRNSETSR
jgi:ADP-heptose:LPS heptosyltransferase